MTYFFIPLWISFVINIVLTFLTFKKLKTLGLDKRDYTIFKRLMLFPLILLVTGFFATINVVYVYLTFKFVAWLQILSVILLSLYGFFNSLAYGFNPIIRDHIYICFNKNL